MVVRSGQRGCEPRIEVIVKMQKIVRRGGGSGRGWVHGVGVQRIESY